jgi:hypothetical protein
MSIFLIYNYNDFISRMRIWLCGELYLFSSMTVFFQDSDISEDPMVNETSFATHDHIFVLLLSLFYDKC